MSGVYALNNINKYNKISSLVNVLIRHTSIGVMWSWIKGPQLNFKCMKKYQAKVKIQNDKYRNKSVRELYILIHWKLALQQTIL